MTAKIHVLAKTSATLTPIYIVAVYIIHITKALFSSFFFTLIIFLYLIYSYARPVCKEKFSKEPEYF